MILTPDEVNQIDSDRVVNRFYLGLTIAGEARGEPREFQMAIGEVIMQRFALALRAKAWRRATTVKDIVMWPWQFSCWNANDSNYKWIEKATMLNLNSADRRAYQQCCFIAEGFIRNVWIPRLDGADHYHTLDLGVRPRWADDKKLIGRVEGRLKTGWFYRLIGAVSPEG